MGRAMGPPAWIQACTQLGKRPQGGDRMTRQIQAAIGPQRLCAQGRTCAKQEQAQGAAPGQTQNQSRKAKENR